MIVTWDLPREQAPSYVRLPRGERREHHEDMAAQVQVPAGPGRGDRVGFSGGDRELAQGLGEAVRSRGAGDPRLRVGM